MRRGVRRGSDIGGVVVLAPENVCGRTKVPCRGAKSGGWVCDGDGRREDGSGMRTGFESVEVCGEKCVKETLPTRWVQADVVHGAGQDQERRAV